MDRFVATKAFEDGHWKPDIELGVAGGIPAPYFYAIYRQGDLVLKCTSILDPAAAERELMRELLSGILEGKYFPPESIDKVE